jgi:glycosyltransferase involved in cell wall biosynthesis
LLISIVIPVYNEEDSIKKILLKIKNIKNINKEIILIDDGSFDKTKSIIKNQCKGLYDKVIFLKKNFGKGYALRKGFEIANGDIIIVQDADLEYDPKDYLKLIKPIVSSKAEVVYGSRVLKGAKRTRPYSIDTLIRILANFFLTFLSNILNNQKLTDAHTCYKVFKKKLLSKITMKENGFNFCPEFTAKISFLGIKIIEVPVSYHGRTHEQGKKIFFIDGLKAIWAIFKYNLLYKIKNI